MAMVPDITAKLDEKLRRVIDIQKNATGCHPLFAMHYPIALAVGDTLHVYVADDAQGSGDYCYRLAFAQPVPQAVRAAFPLDGLEGRLRPLHRELYPVAAWFT